MDPVKTISMNRPNFSWLLVMAWRDCRRRQSRLLLFISSIILGIGALVATFSLGANVRRDIDEQAKELVGADLVVETGRPPASAMQNILDSLGDRRSQERTLASMVYFVKSQGTRLVQVRALEGDYPYYGRLLTDPPAAAANFQHGPFALVDQTLLLQYQAQVGDSIRIGDLGFIIAGILKQAPGRSSISTTVAPPVYIPLRYLAGAGLTTRGSRIGYTYYYQFSKTAELDSAIARYGPMLEKNGFRYETVDMRKRNTNRAFEDFSHFLTLISFIALLLGCIGVASAIHIYIREKVASIAILRCLGATGRQAFLIYLIQVAGMGLFGAILGAGLGIGIQQLLPRIIRDLLPITISTGISWPSVARGISLGVSIALLFALLPLLSVRSIPPLLTLRLSVETRRRSIDPLRLLIYLLILTFVCLFARSQMGSLREAVYFTAGVLLSFLLLAGTAILLQFLVRRFFPSSWSYPVRQGFANLYRPNNQTLLLLCSIGLGACFMGTLYFVHQMLLDRIALSASGAQPNMILFDIQTDQKKAVADLARTNGLPILQEVPVVTLRLETINGKPVPDFRRDSTGRRGRFLQEEMRVTYRDTLDASEKLDSGKLGPPVRSPSDSAYISIEDDFARRAHLHIGDKLLFNVQGVDMGATVGSVRQVDWRRMQTNFRIVFPSGVLEQAPQFHVLITRTPSTQRSASFQREVVQRFPNVSIIDLGLILSVLDQVLDKISFVIRFMAGFSIITGLIVLIASVMISKYQRMQESALLRTLGASRKQLLAITTLEYFFLGALASATGILLSLAASWALAKYSFDAHFRPHLLPALILFLLISLITVTIGLLNSREVLSRPPWEVLGKEN